MRENYNKDIRGRIIAFLSRVSFAHISEVARETRVNRLTATKHLERLKNEGRVEEINKGMLRLFALKKSGGEL